MNPAMIIMFGITLVFVLALRIDESYFLKRRTLKYLESMREVN